MVERKKGPEMPAPPVPDSETPTVPVPRKERSERRLGVDSISLSKEFGMSLNEDAHLEITDENDETGLFAVADGMGGYPGGDVASETVVEALKDGFESLENIRKTRASGDMEASLGAEEEALRKLLYQAETGVHKKREESPPLLRQMGTTGTVIRLTKDERGMPWAIVGQVGDSRAYLLHPDDRLQTLTLDAHPALDFVRSQHGEDAAMRVQDILDELLGMGQLASLQLAIESGTPVPPEAGVTKEDIEFLTRHMSEGLIDYYFTYRSTVQGAFGHDPIIRTKAVPVPPGSKIVLCTDGVHDGLLKREIRSILRGAYDELPYTGVKEAAQSWGDTPAQALAFAAKERGEETTATNFHPRSKGKDDITVVIVDVPER